MDTLNKSINAAKHDLGNIPMYVQRVGGGREVSSMFLFFFISNFLTLKDRKFYLKLISEIGWELAVVKVRRSATLMIRTDGECDYGMECSVNYKINSKSSPVTANKESRSVYVIRLPSGIVNCPNNLMFRNTGCLSCTIDIAPKTYVRMARPFNRVRLLLKGHVASDVDLNLIYKSRETEEDTIAGNLLEQFARTSFPDFKLRVQKDEFPAHKAILAARSKFFSDYLNKNEDKKEMELDTTTGAFKDALHFMYCGGMKKQSLGRMLAVLELAVKLKIKSLQELCVNFLKYEINGRSVHQIRKIGARSGLERLVSAADDFLESDRAL